MKIKEVQISNFRAFSDIKGATFNFINEKDEISDLISIYAPNGFGKTSFYDAVEWGITSKIERFDIVGDFEKTRKENDKGGNKNILQHIGALENGFVNIITEKETFGEKITKKGYNHKQLPKNKFFKDVVLSQEMIDNFLKEQTAEERYNKFVDSYAEVKRYNDTYKNILSLLSYISQETKRLEGEKDKSENKQLEIDFELEFKKFDQINEAISFLNANQESIDSIQKETFNETLYDILTSRVKSRLISLELELEAKKIRIENIRIARDGEKNNESGDNNGGVINYIENRRKLEDLELKIKEAKDIISLIENKEKSQTKIDSLKKELSKKQDYQNLFLSIGNKIDNYLLLHKDITEYDKKIVSLNENSVKIERENTGIREKNKQIQDKFAQLQESLTQTQQKITELPNQKNKLQLAQKSITSLSDEFVKISTSLAEKIKSKEELQNTLKRLDYYDSKIKEDLEFLLELKEFDPQKELIKQQIGIKEKITNKKTELVKAEEKISSQSQLNKELKEYVTRGLEIVSKNNFTDCPLCNQEYKSFENLSDRIINNKLFDVQIKESLETKVKIEDDIKKFIEESNIGIEKFKKYLYELKQPFSTDCAKIEKEIKELSFLKEEKNNELTIAQKNLNEVLLFFDNNLDFSVFEKSTLEQIEKLKTEISELDKTIKSNTSKTSENDIQIKNNVENITGTKEAIEKIKSLTEYSEVTVFFKQSLNANEVDKSYFEEEKLKLGKTIVDLKNTLEENQKLLNDLNTKLSGYKFSKEEYIHKLKELKDLKLLTLKIYESFENYIKTEFNIGLKNESKQQIEDNFNSLIESEKSNQKIIENKYERYKIIEGLKDDCLKATISQKIQIRIDELKDKLKGLKTAEQKLIDEKENLTDYLIKTIDAFFYTDLINAIYKKIDPHPDWKYR